jgi:hypothetical protein
MDQKPVVHVVFSLSAAGCLKDALVQMHCDQRVIGQSDNLSFGPINGVGHAARVDWIRKEFGYAKHEEILQSDDLFWAEATSPEVRPVVWISLRCARDYAGFLQFLWRVPHTDFKVVDTTNIVFPGGHSRTAIAHSLDEMAPEQIIEAQLIDRQTHLTAAEIENHKAVWERLRTENAALRIVGTNGLVSAPITYFDDEISSLVPDSWTKCARVIGEVLSKQWADPFLQTGDMLLQSRLRKLCEAGAFESKGDLSEMRYSEVRRVGQHG